MPYNKRKQKCKQSDGTPGNYVLSYTTKKGEKRSACHTSQKKMQGQIAAIEAEADESEEEVLAELRQYVRALLEAGAASERQEKGLIDAVNSLASKEKPIELRSKGVTIPGVIGAGKREGMNSLGKEPYTDVEFYLQDGSTLNVSAKGDSAPSLAGGGLAALNIILPDLVKTFLEKAVTELQAQGYEKGAPGAPDVYGQISVDDGELVLRGNEAMGGPIDYMYQGPMDVEAEACDRDGQCFVQVNGALTPTSDYAQGHVLYLRARKRRNDQPFDPDMKDRAGLPSLFGKSPSKGTSNRRIVITDRLPGNAIVVDI